MYRNVGCPLTVPLTENTSPLLCSILGIVLFLSNICGVGKYVVNVLLKRRARPKGTKHINFKQSTLKCNFGKALSVKLFHNIQTYYTNALSVPLFLPLLLSVHINLSLFSRLFWSDCVRQRMVRLSRKSTYGANQGHSKTP